MATADDESCCLQFAACDLRVALGELAAARYATTLLLVPPGPNRNCLTALNDAFDALVEANEELERHCASMALAFSNELRPRRAVLKLAHLELAVAAARHRGTYRSMVEYLAVCVEADPLVLRCHFVWCVFRRLCGDWRPSFDRSETLIAALGLDFEKTDTDALRRACW
jgi:hypothetical protein